MWFPIPDKPQPDKAGWASPAFRQIGESGEQREFREWWGNYRKELDG